MGDVVSLRDFRKKKAQKDRDLKAAENRARFGRTRDQKERERRETDRLAEQLEGKKLGAALPQMAEDSEAEGPKPSAPKADDA
jgi:hypothetical protein